ncbi:TIR domain-containing protein [Bacillus sp. JJ1521]|uniref:TIR domain-containing protein n=1 Tax=Bacillus sp. JJ1521 TaxID=3122957 RepID=UPI002FFE794A
MRTEGRNLANPNITAQERLIKSYAYKEGREACVFISHVSDNKSAAIAIGEYIRKSGIDIYLDIYDDDLQRGVVGGDDNSITRSIEKGIDNSTELLCIVSETTKRSWWVPYEIGYGKKAANSISTLLLKDVKDIPSYLKISNLIKGIKGLNEYLTYLADKEKKAYFEKSLPNIQSHISSVHPLDVYMNRNV